MDREEQDREELFKVVRRRAIVGALLIFLGVFIIQIITYAVTMLLVPFFLQRSGEGTGDIRQLLSDPEYQHLFTEWFSLIASVIYIFWCGFLYKNSKWRGALDYREVFQKKHILQIVLIGFCGCFFAIVALTFLQNLFPAVFEEYQKNMGDFNTGSVRMYLYTLLLGPVAEELIFRGALFDRLYLAFPFWIANIIQALLFGLYHGNLIQGTYAFLFGILLGMIHRTGGSIWNNILTHMLFNVTNFIVPVIYQMFAGKSTILFLLMVTINFGGFCYGVYHLYREIGNEPVQN